MVASMMGVRSPVPAKSPTSSMYTAGVAAAAAVRSANWGSSSGVTSMPWTTSIATSETVSARPPSSRVFTCWVQVITVGVPSLRSV